MEFAIESKIFYPSHGAGWIKSQKVITFGGEEKQYYEFQFINNSLNISTPVDHIYDIGVRKVASPAAIKKNALILKSKPSVKPAVKDFNELALVLDELERSTDTNDFIKIIQYCNYEKKLRQKEGRLIPLSIQKHIKNAFLNIAGELAVSTGKTIEEGQKAVEKVTGLKDLF